MIVRKVFTWLLWRSGIASMARRSLVGPGRFVLMFHGVSSKRRSEIPYSLQPSFSKDELQDALSWISKRFRFLTPNELLETGKAGALLTFDDGFANNYSNALPVLEKFQAPAVFFITTQHIQHPTDWLPAVRKTIRQGWNEESNLPNELAVDLFNGMTIWQLEKIGRHPLITIGSHTISHPFLSRCGIDSLKKELVESKRYLQDVSGQEVNLFSYPTGDYNPAVIDMVRSANYRAAFAVDSPVVSIPEFEIQRIGLYHSTPSYLSAKLSGLHRRPLPGRPVLTTR